MFWSIVCFFLISMLRTIFFPHWLTSSNHYFLGFNTIPFCTASEHTVTAATVNYTGNIIQAGPVLCHSYVPEKSRKYTVEPRSIVPACTVRHIWSQMKFHINNVIYSHIHYSPNYHFTTLIVCKSQSWCSISRMDCLKKRNWSEVFIICVTFSLDYKFGGSHYEWW